HPGAVPRAVDRGDHRSRRRRGPRQQRGPPRRPPRFVLIAATALGAIVVALGAYAWRARRRIAVLERRLGQASHELESLQQAFGRFAPSEVVEAIIAQGIATRSETKEVTVLFADLKGFTAIAEQLAPERLVALLNGYFAAMSEVIGEHRGHVAKFIGDGLL